MRIAVIADFSVMGGTRTYFEQLVSLLHDAGNELVGLAPRLDSKDDALAPFMDKHFSAWQTLPGRHGIFSTRQPFAACWEWKHLLPFVLRHRPQVLFFTHGTPGHWLSAFWMPLPSVHVLHSCVLSNKPPESWILPLFLRKLGRNKRLCTVSHFAARLIDKAWHAPATVIYNPAPQQCSASPVMPSGGTRIITLGHVVDYKNPYTWLCVAQRVLARHPYVRFVWYGDGPLLERMRNLSKGLSGVSFPGRIARTHDVFSEADVYFHPSDLESHGISVVEAMCHGLPCVVSKAGGLPESVTDGFNGFILAPDDASGMTDALCQLVESAAIRRTMGNAGKTLAQEKFSFGGWSQQTLSLVNSVIRR